MTHFNRLVAAAVLLVLFINNLATAIPVKAGRDVMFTSRKNKTETFLHWLRQHDLTEVLPPGNSVSIYIPREISNERGLIATKNIPRGKTIVKIPYSVGLELLDSDPLPFEDCDWTMALAAKLLREISKGESSSLKPYLDLMPQDHCIPWLEIQFERFSEIQYQPAMRRIRDLQAETIHAFRSSDPRSLANASWHEFGWALTMVLTHAFHLNVPLRDGSMEAEWRSMFLPVADLINHDNEPNTVWDPEGVFSDHLALISNQYIPKGKPLLGNFGFITTETMFLYHGFVPDNNVWDTTVLFYSMEELVEWFLPRYHYEYLPLEKPTLSHSDIEEFLVHAKKGAERQVRSSGHVLSTHSFQFNHPDFRDGTHSNALVITAEGGIDHRLLGAFIQLLREVDEEDANPSETEWIASTPLALETVSFRCKEILKSFPTTLAEDEIILKKLSTQSTRDHALELAVSFRITKKRALENFIANHPDYQPPIIHDEL